MLRRHRNLPAHTGNNFVRFPLKSVASLRRSDGNGHHDPDCFHFAKCSDGRPDTGTSGNAVVYQNHRLARYVDLTTVAPVESFAALDFVLGLRNNLTDING